MEETWKRESRILQEKRVLAFFGKSEKVLAPRKKEKERGEKIENTQRVWILVNGARSWKIAGQNEWTIETLVET